MKRAVSRADSGPRVFRAYGGARASTWNAKAAFGAENLYKSHGLAAVLARNQKRRTETDSVGSGVNVTNSWSGPGGSERSDLHGRDHRQGMCDDGLASRNGQARQGLHDRLHPAWCHRQLKIPRF